MPGPVYASDPDVPPDDAFEPGRLDHAVVGNRGRLLDARRTPITVTEVTPEYAEVEIRVDAFEDRGARWRLPVWALDRFQFEVGSQLAARDAADALRTAGERLRRPLRIAADPGAREATLRAIAAQRTEVRALLARVGLAAAVDLGACVERRQGLPELMDALGRHLEVHDVADLDAALSRTMVSNPASGELVKGHAIALAELGLCPFDGEAVRNPGTFDGRWSAARRKSHLIARLAFTQELYGGSLGDPITLYRGAATDGAVLTARARSFVSCTFSRDVAESHFAGGPTTRAAAIWRQHVPVQRLLMTFLETEAMNDPFREAEAVLIGDPAAPAF